MPRSEDNEPSGREFSKTVSLSDRDLRDAARLFRLFADPTCVEGTDPQLRPQGAGDKGRETLIARARALLDGRRLRDRFFSPLLFGEPAWDILLILYVSEQSSGRMSISRLAEWIGVPFTTAGRWVKFLEDEQLVQRTAHPTDRRTMFISLRDKGRTALDAYFGMIAE